MHRVQQCGEIDLDGAQIRRFELFGCERVEVEKVRGGSHACVGEDVVNAAVEFVGFVEEEAETLPGSYVDGDEFDVCVEGVGRGLDEGRFQISDDDFGAEVGA